MENERQKPFSKRSILIIQDINNTLHHRVNEIFLHVQ